MELCSECGIRRGSYPVVEEGQTVYPGETVTGRITDIRRIGRSYSGNPNLRVQINGKWYRTSENISLAYVIGNPEYRDIAHVFELSRFGRLNGTVHPVEEHTVYYCAGCLPSGSFHLLLPVK